MLKLTHHSGSVGDGLLLGCERLWLENVTALLWHVRSREVTEGRVLWLGQQLVVRALEGLGTCLAQHFLEVVLENLGLGESGSLASHCLLSHFVVD